VKTWEYADRDQWCGGREQCRIKAGDPVYCITLKNVARVIVRCQTCAWEPVDWVQVAASKKRQEGLQEEKARVKRELTSLKNIAADALRHVKDRSA
jgi:hypothetical protein